MDVVVEKFIVRIPRPYSVPKKWSSYTYCRIFIDNEYKGEWQLSAYGGIKKFIEIAKKKFKFEEYKLTKGSSENRNY